MKRVLLFAVLLSTTVPSAAGEAADLTAEVADDRPNILLIVTDDQPWALFKRTIMPGTFERLVDHGFLFRRAYVSTPACCPSRAQILTGTYQHDNRVVYNTSELHDPTIVAGLRELGYRTMLSGKYLNSHDCSPLPEFTKWVCTAGGGAGYTKSDPLVNEGGVWTRRTGYTTEILADEAEVFANGAQPFFVLYAPPTPHLPLDDDRYATKVIRRVRPESFNHFDAGKPEYMRRGTLTAEEKLILDDRYRAMATHLRALDDDISALIDSMPEDTIVLFVSDNGYLLGELRRWGKGVPYEESVRVPMAIAGKQVGSSSKLVMNIDLTATIAKLAGVPWASDGRSLLGLMLGRPWTRGAVLLEYCLGSTFLCPGREEVEGQEGIPGWVGVVQARWKYVETGTGEKELYDLWADPLEMRNLYGTMPYQQHRLAGLLEDLRDD